MGQQRVTMMECDNPSCDERFEHSRDEPAPGYHLGRGMWVLGGGGPIPKTYACSLECISAAIEQAVFRGGR